IKAQAAVQLEQVRTEGKKEIEAFKAQVKQGEVAAKMQAEASKEREQLAADLQTNAAEQEREAIAKREQLQADMIRDEADRDLERDKMALDYRMHREDIESREAVAERNQQASIQKAQAQSIGKALEKNERAQK